MQATSNTELERLGLILLVQKFISFSGSTRGQMDGSERTVRISGPSARVAVHANIYCERHMGAARRLTAGLKSSWSASVRQSHGGDVCRIVLGTEKLT